MYKVNDGEWSTAVGKEKNAGSYTVCYKVVGNENYKDVPEQSFTVIISPWDINRNDTQLKLGMGPMSIKAPP